MLYMILVAPIAALGLLLALTAIEGRHVLRTQQLMSERWSQRD